LAGTFYGSRLTRFFGYTSCKKWSELISKEKQHPEESDPFKVAYEIIGDIAVLRVPDHPKTECQTVAKAIMKKHKKVRTVLLQVGGVSGELRLRQLEWVMGEKKTQTLYKEWGCMYKVDLETCYFSPRLSFERMRITHMVKPGETIVNMFAGVGCFSVPMAKTGRAQIVYSIDKNSSAVKYLQENARLNRVEAQVVSIQGDAKDIIAKHLRSVADRVLMPLPDKAYEYLKHAVVALKPAGGWIHYYNFQHASGDEDPLETTKSKVAGRLQKLGVEFALSSGRVVRSTGPNWHQVVLDIQAFT